ncbi:uncharacterized protein LOC114974603 [Acropora millepora]|uniref:uncharacterized protein LOC114974603 n=1 Tax=Acropora millepora TaxID=45264 RepID=UPI001CF2E95D|nr:uncharacterized protein LOC114974603 [Acropora millepora]
MDLAVPVVLLIVLSYGVAARIDLFSWKKNASLKCPPDCLCSNSLTDLSLVKTDCSNRNHLLIPMGLSPSTTHADFADNRILRIARENLAQLKKVKNLNLATNLISDVPNGLLSDLLHLEVIDLSENRIGFIRAGVFDGLLKLTTIYLNENRISNLESGSFRGLTNLKYLWLNINKIRHLPRDVFHGLDQLKLLSLGLNGLTQLNAHLLSDAKKLEYLFLQHNEIKRVPDFFFKNNSKVKYVFLHNNNITTIGPNTFKGAASIELLSLSNNPELADLKKDSFTFKDFRNLSFIYILQTSLVRIKMNSFRHQKNVGVVIYPTEKVYPVQVSHDHQLREGLTQSGFNCDDVTCTPCGFGTYHVRSTNGSYVCKKCPAGGFYQNTFGHHGTLTGNTGCLSCPNGTYVELDKVPGKHQHDCRVCPAGTKRNEWAGYRGCFCIDSFYRKGMFKQCMACPQGIRGIICNETILVREGFWWQFRDDDERWKYQRFVDALMIPDHTFNHADVNFTGIFPKPYPCPRAASCLGLLNSVRKPCETGYGGPLCEVCIKGYYKSMSRCAQCPTLPWLVTQILFVVCFVCVLVFILTRGDKKTEVRRRALSDIVLAQFKIIIGFYQVTAGSLDAFSYIQWPEALLQLSSYAKVFQLDLIQIAPLHCLYERLKMDAYSGLLLTLAFNAGIVVLIFAYFQSRKLWIKLARNASPEEKQTAISLSKIQCYRSAFLVLFVTFPDISSRIIRLLPPACHQICQDVVMKNCSYYLKADYSLRCFDKTYNAYLTAFYVGSVYPVLFPLFIAVVLYFLYYRLHIKNSARIPQPKRHEVVEGLRFIYENYNERSWYWEIVETIRKLILTSGLSLIGTEGRTYIGMAAVASGFYAVAYAQAQPIVDKFEHQLQLVSLVATFFNLSVGVLLRIPSEMVDYSIEKDKGAIGITIVLVAANVMVIGLVLVRFLVSLFKNLYGALRNPHCSWECCLGVILSTMEAEPNLRVEARDVASQDVRICQDIATARTIDVEARSRVEVTANDSEEELTTEGITRETGDVDIVSMATSECNERL